jgi:hypothetical protein
MKLNYTEITKDAFAEFPQFLDMKTTRVFLLQDIITPSDKKNMLEQAFHYGVTSAINAIIRNVETNKVE